MEKEERSKYARGINKIQLGVWGFKTDRIYSIHLTTRLGDDNSTARFGKDFRKLIRWMRSLGYKVEYCFAMGLTPEKGLLHGHGLIRFGGSSIKLYDGAVRSSKTWRDGKNKLHSKHIDGNRRALGDKWNQCHGAFSVDLAGFYGKETFEKYITKHIMKDYINASMIRNSFLMSFGWKRKGYENIITEVKDFWEQGTGNWLGTDGWRLANKAVKAYCERTNLLFTTSFGGLFMTRGKCSWDLYDFNKEGGRE